MKAGTLFPKARWIWPVVSNWDLFNGYALFRKAFLLEAVPRRAPLFITADQSYQLYINGHYVGRGPARGFQSHWPYDEHDVSRFLRRGRNVIAVRAYNPGCANFQYLSEGQAGLFVAACWGRTGIFTGTDWKARRQSGVRRHTVPSSLQLFPQEHIDLREEDPAWMLPGYDDRGWTDEISCTVWNAMPWYSLEERGIPLLEEGMWERPVRVRGESGGISTSDYRDTCDVAKLRHSEGLRHDPVDAPAKRIVVRPMKVGSYRSFLVDFGTTVVGSVGFRIDGARGGEIVDTLHFETIDEAARTPEYIPDLHCRMAFGHRMVCRKGRQEHTFYHAFGFRYMVVTVRDAVDGLVLKPHLRLAIYPMEKRGGFHASDPVLNGIWETCAWTQRVCSLDAYVDTPWREQAQWWGDARVQAWNTFHYSGDARLFRRGIAQIAGQVTPDGLTYGHAPTMAHGCILPDFSLIWLLTLHDYYWQTGSLEAFLSHKNEVEGILEYFRRHTDAASRLVAFDPRYWLFLDWADIQKDGCPSVLNLWLVLALEKMAELYVLVGERKKGAELRSWSGRLRRSLRGLIGKDGLIRDGILPNGKMSSKVSPHAQTLAIMVRLRPASEKAMIEKSLLPFLRGRHVNGVTPSIYWTTYILTTLREHGHGHEIVEYIRKYWAPMTDHGTACARYLPTRGEDSFSHAWSAHPLYHLMQILGGVVQSAPGWTSIDYAPVFHGEFAEVTIPSPLGDIHSEWKREGSLIKASLSLPRGMTAVAALPGLRKRVVQGRSEWKIRFSQEQI